MINMHKKLVPLSPYDNSEFVFNFTNRFMRAMMIEIHIVMDSSSFTNRSRFYRLLRNDQISNIAMIANALISYYHSLKITSRKKL